MLCMGSLSLALMLLPLWLIFHIVDGVVVALVVDVVDALLLFVVSCFFC